MNKREKCFVIMPISDQGDYSNGHFDKVYEHIFKPAIEEAGYEAYRVDEDKICDSIIAKIFKAIQECPMALCDLSNRNPNVLYELGIRQAYDKAVVLVQDEKTDKIFDVSGINTIQYSSRRVYEEVLRDRKKICEAIISTKEGKENSITKVVSVKKAEISEVDISKDDKLEIMISGLIDEVKSLKQEKNYAMDNLYRRHIRRYEELERDNNLVTREFVYKLKQDITKKTLMSISSILNKKFGEKIRLRKEENILYVYSRNMNEEDLMEMKVIIEDYLEGII
ncbi:MAG: hypothetical protein E7262_00540 [Lachnospiraceae bacterium]|nr:hypothetical protein [Lachnospiraceae bacterium]